LPDPSATKTFRVSGAGTLQHLIHRLVNVDENANRSLRVPITIVATVLDIVVIMTVIIITIVIATVVVTRVPHVIGAKAGGAAENEGGGQNGEHGLEE
jgi:hypothetical protein